MAACQVYQNTPGIVGPGSRVIHGDYSTDVGVGVGCCKHYRPHCFQRLSGMGCGLHFVTVVSDTMVMVAHFGMNFLVLYSSQQQLLL